MPSLTGTVVAAPQALQVMLEMAQGKHSSTAPKGKHRLNSSLTPSNIIVVDESNWEPPVHTITATEGKGIPALVEEIHRHAKFLQDSQLWQQKEAARLRRDLEALIRDMLVRKWQQELDENKYESVLTDVIQRKFSPIEALDLLL